MHCRRIILLGIVRTFMFRKLKSAAKFASVMIAMTIVCAIAWQEGVAEYLYDRTDSVPGDFSRPGDWVHSFGGYSIVPVQHVVHGRSMSEPDTIKAGWGMVDLWLLWLSFVGVSVAVSFFLARKRWLPGTGTMPNNARVCVKTQFPTIRSICSIHQNAPYQKYDRYRISLRHFLHSLALQPTATAPSALTEK